MRFPLCLAHLVLICASVRSANVSIDIGSFVNVILDLRKFYSAATVIFTHPGDAYGDYGDLQITHLVHSCSRALARHYVVTVDFHFKRMHRSLRYHHRIVQPLAVVILPDFEGFLEFAEAAGTFSMSFPVWFVLFFYTAADGTCDVCHRPIGNPFNLAFDTQMLVLCRDDDVLREWYSVKDQTTRIFDLANWTQTGFVPLTRLSLYDRRKDMEGTILRAVTVKDQDVPISPTYTGNYVAGLYGRVLNELAQSLNFTLHIVAKVNEHGTWHRKNRTWSGVMGEIVSGRADFAIADMSMTSPRIRYVDFTLPLIISKNSLFIREPDICGVKWFGYFQTFHLYTWSAILTVIAVTPFLLCFMRTCCESRNVACLISDNFLCVWGIFCQQALTEFPRRSSLRIAVFTILCTAILITAYYSAALVCFLTACIRVLPFRTTEEFIKDGTYKLIVPRGSAEYDTIARTMLGSLETSNESFPKKLMKLMREESELPSTLIGGFVQVCTEEKVAYLVLNALKKSVETRIPCKLTGISTETIENLAMVLSKGNPYTGAINYHLQKFLDNGMMMRLRKTEISTRTVENIGYEPVPMVSVVPILAILAGGVILGVVVLTVEKIHYRLKKEKKHPPSRVFFRSRKSLPLSSKR